MQSPSANQNTSPSSTPSPTSSNKTLQLVSLHLKQARAQLSAHRAHADRLERENLFLRARTAGFESLTEDREALFQQHEWLHEQYHDLQENHQRLWEQHLRVTMELYMMELEKQIQGPATGELQIPPLGGDQEGNR